MTRLKRKEFGDFQTPLPLAKEVCTLLRRKGVKPRSLIEPTVGLGSFLLAGLDSFPSLKKALGFEINKDHLSSLKGELAQKNHRIRVQLIEQDFFSADWKAILDQIEPPILVIGNPPWITNSALGIFNGSNLPKKSNFQGHKGLDALTGKSNFDISEWMLIRLFEHLSGRPATLAMLCKTAVARKVLAHSWNKRLTVSMAEMHLIDTQQHFGVTVDACLLIAHFSKHESFDCSVYSKLGINRRSDTFGFRDNQLVADVVLYEQWKHLAGESGYRWRSGIKHDCSAIMELIKDGTGYKNSLGEPVEIEEDFLYPMVKSSDITNRNGTIRTRFMIVPQQHIGEDTALIRVKAPKTWNYLLRNERYFNARSSTIYKKRPPFSIFGVGRYSFTPWKVVISGFYKYSTFKVVGPVGNRPIVLDDTCYFLPCQNKEEADYLVSLLNSTPAQEFYRAFIFWDAKRPITASLLSKLRIELLAEELGSLPTLIQFMDKKQ